MQRGGFAKTGSPRSCGEEPRLAVEPAAVADEAAVRADDPVAGQDDGDGVGAVGRSDRTRRPAAEARPAGKVSVAPRLAVGDAASAAQTRRRNGVPSGATAISNSRSSPAK